MWGSVKIRWFGEPEVHEVLVQIGRGLPAREGVFFEFEDEFEFEDARKGAQLGFQIVEVL